MAQLTPTSGYWPSVVGPELLAGVGLGLSFVPLTLGATAGVPPHQAGLAAGLLNTTRQIGGAIGLAAMATAAAAVHPHSTTHRVVIAALTNGYDRAFTIAAGTLAAGALAALVLPHQLGTAPPAAQSTSTTQGSQALSSIDRPTTQHSIDHKPFKNGSSREGGIPGACGGDFPGSKPLEGWV